MYNSNNTGTVLRSPDTMVEMEPTEEANVYLDPANHMKYYVNDDGKIIKLANPLNGLPIDKREDGLYERTDGLHEGYNQVFSLDKERGAFIPHYIPDDTLESAHIEEDYLVGDSTGRRFPITEKGKVVVPFDPIDIDPNVPREELEKYFEERKQRQLSATQEEIDEKIRQDEIENQKAVDRAIEEIRNTYETPSIREKRIELEEIEKSIIDGKMPEKNFDRLLEISGFDETSKQMIISSFDAAGKIIHEKEMNPGDGLENDDRQMGQ